MTQPEPRFVRVERPSKSLVAIFPQCERCGKRLEGMQRRWCGNTCRNAVWSAERSLNRFWRSQDVA